MSIKIAQKYFHLKNERFSHLFKNCAKTWAKKFAAGFNAWPILVTLLKIVLSTCSTLLEEDEGSHLPKC